MELLMVFAILGILASMVGPGAFNYFKKQRAKESAEKVLVLINEGFSSARSTARSVKIEAINGDATATPPALDKIILLTCDKTDCSGTNTEIKSEEFPIDVENKNGDFDFIFTAPYGKIIDNNNIFTEENNDQLTIKIENKYKYEVIVRKLSGLSYIKAVN